MTFEEFLVSKFGPNCPEGGWKSWFEHPGSPAYVKMAYLKNLEVYEEKYGAGKPKIRIINAPRVINN